MVLGGVRLPATVPMEDDLRSALLVLGGMGLMAFIGYVAFVWFCWKWWRDS
jgi:hypothetical protein